MKINPLLVQLSLVFIWVIIIGGPLGIIHQPVTAIVLGFMFIIIWLLIRGFFPKTIPRRQNSQRRGSEHKQGDGSKTSQSNVSRPVERWDRDRKTDPVDEYERNTGHYGNKKRLSIVSYSRYGVRWKKP